MVDGAALEKRSPIISERGFESHPLRQLGNGLPTQRANMKYTTLCKIESGVIKKPFVLVMAKIAEALGVSIEDLLK